MVKVFSARRLGRILLLAVLALSALAAGGCFKEGGGSDTETLTGVLRLANGSPAAGATVKLIPVGYDPSMPDSDFVRISVTDAEGRFKFQGPTAFESGVWNLIAVSAGGKEGAFHQALRSDSVPAMVTLEPARTYLISLHSGDSYQMSDSGRAWFPGTDVFVRCDGITATQVTGVPRGVTGLVLVSKAGWRHDYEVTNPNNNLIIRANRAAVLCESY